MMPRMSNTSNWGSITSLALAVALSSALAGCSEDSSKDGKGAGGGGANGGASGGANGGANGGASTGLPNPCTLTTQAELGAIVDIPLVRTEELRGLSGSPSCTWFDANDDGIFQLSLWKDDLQYEFSKSQATSVPLSGLGAEAHLGKLRTVHVLRGKGDAFFTQALRPVSDGKVSTEIQSAASAGMMADLQDYEAAFRFAKLIENAF